MVEEEERKRERHTALGKLSNRCYLANSIHTETYVTGGKLFTDVYNSFKRKHLPRIRHGFEGKLANTGPEQEFLPRFFDPQSRMRSWFSWGMKCGDVTRRNMLL